MCAEKHTRNAHPVIGEQIVELFGVKTQHSWAQLYNSPRGAVPACGVAAFAAISKYSQHSNLLRDDAARVCVSPCVPVRRLM